MLDETGIKITANAPPDSGFHVVISTDAQLGRLSSDAAMLGFGGWHLLRLGSRRRRPWARIGRGSVRHWHRQLERHGYDSVTAYWHAPNEQRCSYLVNISDKVAVDAMLSRYHGVRFGKLKSILTRNLNRVGLIHLIARDITIVGRRCITATSMGLPPVETPVSTEPIRGLLVHRHTRPSTLLITPWFEASRHVVGLYYEPATSALLSVAKFPRRAWDTSGIVVEATALGRIASDNPALDGYLPQVHGITLDSRPHLIETALIGEAVDPGRVREDLPGVVNAGFDLVERLAAPKPRVRQLSARHRPARVHTGDWFERLVEQPLRRFAAAVPVGAEGPTLVARTLEVLAPLRTARLPLVNEHGDLSHPNLIMTATDRMSALDWERFEPAGLPCHDLTFFLQYIGESKSNAVERHSQLVAFDHAFVGPDAWARPLLTRYATRVGVSPGILPLLIVSTWARTSAGLLERLAPSHSVASDDQAPEPARLAQAFRLDRDYAIWRHALHRFDSILR